MRKLLTLTLLLCLILVTPSYAQSSSGAGAPARPTKNQIIEGLLAENDAAKQRIADLEAHESELRNEVAKADDATGSWRDAHDKALVELGETRATIAQLRSAVDERTKQVEDLRSQRDEARGERDSARAEVKALKRENRFLKFVTTLQTAATVAKIFL